MNDEEREFAIKQLLLQLHTAERMIWRNEREFIIALNSAMEIKDYLESNGIKWEDLQNIARIERDLGWPSLKCENK